MLTAKWNVLLVGAQLMLLLLLKAYFETVKRLKLQPWMRYPSGLDKFTFASMIVTVQAFNLCSFEQHMIVYMLGAAFIYAVWLSLELSTLLLRKRDDARNLAQAAS